MEKAKKLKKVVRTIKGYYTNKKVPENAVYISSILHKYPKKVEYVVHYYEVYS